MTTEGTLLGGQVRYDQPAGGFRSGIEPVLMAAAVPAKPGQRVLEGGTGAGAALLCVAARVRDIRGLGVEIDPALAALAARNAEASGFAGIQIVASPLETASLAADFDHAMANPPYHAGDGTASPDRARELAKRGGDSLLTDWISRLSRALRHRGSLTLIVPAGRVPCCLAAMKASGCACSNVIPLWPKADRAAKLVVLRGVRHGRGDMRLCRGLVLHDRDGGFTPKARAILYEGQALTP